MRLPYDLIILDLEANMPSGKLIEIGAVRLMRDGGISKDTFSEFIQIDEPLTDYIINLTGITEKDLKKAKNFTEVGLRFYNWATKHSKNILLCSWGNWDIPALRKNYEDNLIKYPFRGKSMDIKSIVVFLSCMFGKKLKSDGLTQALKQWGLKFEGERHRAKDDALMTAKLLQTIWKDYEETGKKIKHQLSKLGVE